MGKIKKTTKWLFVLCAIGSIAYFLVNKYIFDKKEVSTDKNFVYEEINPEIKDIVDAIALYGSAKIKNEQKLTFSQSGKITSVTVKTGQFVKKGDILASVENTVAQNAVKDAERALHDASIELKDALDETKWKIQLEKMYQDIEKSKIDIQDRKNNKQIFLDKKSLEKQAIELSLKGVESDKAIAEKEYKKALLDLETSTFENTIAKNALKSEPDDKSLEITKKEQRIKELQVELDEKLNNPNIFIQKRVKDFEIQLLNDVSEIKDFSDNLEKSLKTANEVLNINNKRFDNYSSEKARYFSAKNSVYKSEAQAKGLELYRKMEELNNKVLLLGEIPTVPQIIELYEYKKSMTSLISQLGEKLKKASEKSIASEGIVSIGDFSVYESLGETLKQSSNKNGVEEDKKINDYKLLSSIDNLKKKAELELENDKQSLKDEQKELEKLKKDYASSLGIVNTSLQGKNLDEAYKTLEKERLEIGYKEKIRTIDASVLENKDNLINIEKDIKEYDRETIQLELALKESLDEYNTRKQKGNSERIRSAKNTLESAKSSLDNAKKGLDDYVVKAPFDGEIKKIGMRVGDVTGGASGKQGEDYDIVIQNPDLIEISVSIPQTQIPKVTLGKLAKIKFDAFPTKEFQGSVTAIDALGDQGSSGGGGYPGNNGGGSAVNYNVKITMEKKGTNILTGMTAQVLLIGKEAKSVLTIPFTAAEINDEGKYEVQKVTQTGDVVTVPIETGIVTTKLIQVVGGITKDDKIEQVAYDSSNFEMPKEDMNQTGF